MDAPDAFRVLVVEPAGQALHAIVEPPEKFPAGHGTHEAMPTLGAMVPAAHAVHESPVLRIVPLNPALHMQFVTAIEPVDAVLELAGHAKHAARPEVAA